MREYFRPVPSDGRTRVIKDEHAGIMTVLHVDDEKTILLLTKKYLEKLSNGSLKVDSLADSRQVFEKLAEKNYAAIVSDYQMPGLDGLQLLERLRDQGSSIPLHHFHWPWKGTSSDESP